jgi:hypothetical protein
MAPEAQPPYRDRMDDRPSHRHPEPAQAVADDDLPLDHHVEEVLAALSEIAVHRELA